MFGFYTAVAEPRQPRAALLYPRLGMSEGLRLPTCRFHSPVP